MNPRASARQTLVRIQARREHSERELRLKLGQRGYEQDAIDDAVAFAKKHDLQDDGRYARSQGRLLAARNGNRAMSARLTSNGVDKATAAAVVEDLPDEAERALAALHRFSGKPLDAALRQKAWRFLTGRGFSSASAASAWRQFERNSRSEDGPSVEPPEN